ncbi:MAG: immunoglobulin domain-containing protein, partial [Candidatus Eisenbacteria bacterium]
TVPLSETCVNLEVLAGGSLTNGVVTPSSFTATGWIKNHGTIDDGIQTLRVKVGGDLIDDGLWANSETTLIGANERHLSQTASGSFESHLLRDAASTGALVIDTPFAILGNLDQAGRTTVLAPGAHLTLEQGYFAGMIDCNGNEIRFQSWSYLTNATVDEAVLVGPAKIGSVHFMNGVTVTNSLTNQQSLGAGHVTVDGTLKNLGSIFNSDYGLIISLNGDFICDGSISNSFVSLDGPNPHHLWMGPAGNIEAPLFLPEFGTGSLEVETDARISDGVALGLQGSMILVPGADLQLTGGSITGGTLLTQGNAVLMEGAGSLNLTQVDNLVLNGSAHVTGAMNIAGDLTVMGALSNWPFAISTIAVEGDLINSGEVHNESQALTLRVKGDVRNGGPLDCQRGVERRPRARGRAERLIACPEFVLQAGFSAGSYQWFRDGLAIPGANAANLILNTVDNGDLGVYQCHGGGGQLSRTVTILPGGTTGLGEFDTAITFSNPCAAQLTTSRGGVVALTFALTEPQAVSPSIFDASGREVSTWPPANCPPGNTRSTGIQVD